MAKNKSARPQKPGSQITSVSSGTSGQNGSVAGNRSRQSHLSPASIAALWQARGQTAGYARG